MTQSLSIIQSLKGLASRDRDDAKPVARKSRKENRRRKAKEEDNNKQKIDMPNINITEWHHDRA